MTPPKATDALHEAQMLSSPPEPAAEAPAPAPAPPARKRTDMADRWLPLAGGLGFLALWQDGPELLHALAFTAAITLSAFLLALASGVMLGVALTQNRRIERMLWPYAVALQVTPMVAIAPLVVIWVGLSRAWLALLVLAWVVAFFPILSNTVLGMKSADHGLKNVFTLYRASRWQRFCHLQLPAALPYIIAGMRVSAGLSVIGAVVAEFVAGSGGTTGLAWVITQSGSMLDIARMFAALVVLTAFGLAMNMATGLIQRLLLGAWHESAIEQEN